MILSYSDLKLFLECPRKFRYKSLDGWSPTFDGFALPLGKAVHRAVELMVQGESREAALAEATALFFGDIPKELDEKQEKKVLESEHQLKLMLEDYPKHDGRVEVIGTEVKLSAPMPYGHTFVGTIDLVARINGDLWVWDTKTTGDAVEKAAKGNRIRLQYPGYAHLAEQHYGEPVRGMMVDLIHKPRVYVRKDGTINPETKSAYLREPVAIGASRIRDFIAWFNNVAGTIALNVGGSDTLAPGAFPMNDGSCQKWGRTCPYYEGCHNPDRAVQLFESSTNFEPTEDRYADEESNGG